MPGPCVAVHGPRPRRPFLPEHLGSHSTTLTLPYLAQRNSSQWSRLLGRQGAYVEGSEVLSDLESVTPDSLVLLCPPGLVVIEIKRHLGPEGKRESIIILGC